MSIDYQELANLASAIQSFVVAIGLIAGGIWTIITFKVFALRDKAEAELQRYEREIEHYDQKLEQSPVVEVSMQATKLTVPNDSHQYIVVDVTVANKGNKAANINLDKPPLTIARVEISNDNIPLICSESQIRIYYVDYVDTTVKSLIKLKLRPGLSEVYSFIGRVDQPGVYLLTFQLPVPSDDKDIKFTPIAPWWGTSRFLVVT